MIRNDRILIVPKLSKFDWDLRRLQLDEAGLMRRYAEEGVDVERILDSHRAQAESLRTIRAAFPGAATMARDDLSLDSSRNADLLIALGGDNHFLFVTHHCGATPVLGVNSDPAGSEGALTCCTADTLARNAAALRAGEYVREAWPRLQAEINGRPFAAATSEYFFGETKRMFMTRHRLRLGERTEMQRGSGFLVVTGAGSTGWYHSACRFALPGGDVFPKTNREARFLMTEPYHGRLSGYAMAQGTLRAGETLEIVSLNDNAGIATADSMETAPFPRGAVAKIRVSGESVSVVRLRG